MIVITNMESLPDHCYECPCHDGESGYCQANEELRYSDYRPYWCPLKEIHDDQKDGEMGMNDLISRDAAIEAVKKVEAKAFNSFHNGLVKARKIIADQPEAPDSRYAMERYEDLCSGRDADFIECILHNRDEFKSWLERLEWHVDKCDELSQELRKKRPEALWIVDQDWTGYFGECSECHKVQRIGKVPYCPFCGAKMGV